MTKQAQISVAHGHRTKYQSQNWTLQLEATKAKKISEISCIKCVLEDLESLQIA